MFKRLFCTKGGACRELEECLKIKSRLSLSLSLPLCLSASLSLPLSPSLTESDSSHLYIHEIKLLCDLRELASRLANPFGHPWQVRTQVLVLRFYIWPAALRRTFQFCTKLNANEQKHCLN